MFITACNATNVETAPRQSVGLYDIRLHTKNIRYQKLHGPIGGGRPPPPPPPWIRHCSSAKKDKHVIKLLEQNKHDGSGTKELLKMLRWTLEVCKIYSPSSFALWWSSIVKCDSFKRLTSLIRKYMIIFIRVTERRKQ